MRVIPSAATVTSRRFAALLLAVSALGALSGCRGLVDRTRRAESISIAPNNLEVSVNSSVRVVATAFDKNGASLSGSRNPRFSSQNNAIATVTNEGLVIGVSPGQTIIEAILDDARGQAAVTVIPEVPANILVQPAPVTLRRGNIRQFTATPRNSQGTPISGLTLTWQSSNSAIASVSSSGEVTALAPGNVIITATANQISGTSQVTVTEVPIGAISLAPTSRSIQVNEQFQPDLTLRDTAGNVIPSTGRTISWSSSNSLNASVTNLGVIRGERVGTARITAAAPENSAINGAIDITVTERLVKTVVITPRTGFLRLGVPRQLNAQLLDSLNQNVTGRVVNWTSLTPTVASISANGSVTGLALGTARFTAQVDAAVDTVQFTVTRIPVGEVTLAPSQTSVIQGKTVTLAATVKDSVGTEVTDRPLTWLTSNQTTASVADGVVTGVSPGSVTITAQAEGRSGTASVTVLQVPVDSIALADPNDLTFQINSVAPGNSKQVQLELLDADGNTVLNRNLLITSTVPSRATATWNQTTRVLTVTATAGATAGETIIRVRALGGNGLPEGKQTSITVTVNVTP
jgi:uncharacterized protein YjdB